MARKIKQNHAKTPEIDLSAALNQEPASAPAALHNSISSINSLDNINKDMNKDMNRVSLSDEDINILNIELNSVVLKAQFTEKEKKFLELFLSSNYSQQDAVRKAGYTAKHRQSRNLIVKRILEKYCQSAQDHKEIFRQGYVHQ